MPRKKLLVTPNDAGQRLDKFLTKTFPNLPQQVLYKCIRTKDVRLNGARCAPDSRLSPGDALTLYWQEEYFQQAPKEYDFLKAPARLRVVYEDESLMLLDKPPGLIVTRETTTISTPSLPGCSAISTTGGSTARRRRTPLPRPWSTASTATLGALSWPQKQRKPFGFSTRR